MSIKECITCKKEFETKNPNKFYCSDECRTKDLTRKCIRCDKEFVLEKKSAKKVYCSKSCAVAANNELGIMGKNAPKMKGEHRAILTCDNCGKEFERIMSQVRKWQNKDRKHKFCLKECYIEHLSRNTEQKYCVECNKPLPLNYKSKNKKFCSKECQHKHHTVTLKCDYCEKEYTRGKANVAESTHHFCSRECYRNYSIYESKRLKTNKYTDFRDRLQKSSEYKKWKKIILEKYNHKCALCDETSDLNVHHIVTLYKLLEETTKGVYNAENFVKVLHNDLIFNTNNGIALCPTHHKMCHNK